jgi:hypothetical protein
MWHALHDGYLGNAPPGRLQVDGFLDQQCHQHWPKTSVRDRRVTEHENQTDSDVRLGWFQQKGFAALMPKPICPTLSLSPGGRLLCLRGTVVKISIIQ